MRNANFAEGTRFMVMRLVRTVVYFFVMVIALDTADIDMTVFWASSAALLVGVGIGLQNFFNDVVSGFVLLFEGGVRVGDELEVEGMMVRVERIDLRSTRVITRYGNLIVMPNGLISGEKVRNFTQGEPATLIQVEVGVAACWAIIIDNSSSKRAEAIADDFCLSSCDIVCQTSVMEANEDTVYAKKFGAVSIHLSLSAWRMGAPLHLPNLMSPSII